MTMVAILIMLIEDSLIFLYAIKNKINLARLVMSTNILTCYISIDQNESLSGPPGRLTAHPTGA